MQQDVLPSARKIADSAKFVRISPKNLSRFCLSLQKGNLEALKINLFTYLGAHKWDEERVCGLITLFNCINFSYWADKGEEKWAIKIGGETLDGSVALFRLLEKTILAGIPFLEASFLANLGENQLAKILRGNVEIPMFSERLNCLREAGRILLERFNGNFINILQETNGSAVRYTNLLIESFPSFFDSAVVGGIKVEFHKRAQLNAKMVSDALGNKGLGKFTDLDRLTIFADYKIPQVLRKLGILEYERSLAERADSYLEIPAGSREEVEIRASSIWAVEEMKQKLKPKFPWVTSAVLDSYFWLVGQNKSPDDKPYHRTRTIFY